MNEDRSVERLAARRGALDEDWIEIFRLIVVESLLLIFELEAGLPAAGRLGLGS